MNNQYDENNHANGQDGNVEEINDSAPGQTSDSTYGQPLYTGGETAGPAGGTPPSGGGTEQSTTQYSEPNRYPGLHSIPGAIPLDRSKHAEKGT